MAYVRVPVPTPKTKKGLNTFRLVVVSILLAAMLIVCIALATSGATATVHDLTTADALKSGEVYYIESLMVLDTYGEVETTDGDNKNVTQKCYIVSFKDRNGQRCIASLGVKNGSPIMAQCDSYITGLQNETMPVGSLTLSGCFSVAAMDGQMYDMQMGYSTTYQELKLYGYSGENTAMHLNYEDATKEGYLDQHSSDTTIGACITGVFAALLAVALFFTLRQRKKIKAQEQAAKEAVWRFEQNFAPQPNAPVQPIQPVAPQSSVTPSCPVCRNSDGNQQENGRWRCVLCGTVFVDPAPQNFT